MIDIDTNILTETYQTALKDITNGELVQSPEGDLKIAQIGTQSRTEAFLVGFSDGSAVVASSDHIFGGHTVEEILKWEQLEYEVPSVTNIDFKSNNDFDLQDGVDMIFDLDAEHLPGRVLYASLRERERVFTGMQDGFRDIDGAFIATVFSETYAEDIATLCRSLGHNAEVMFVYKAMKHWNIIVTPGPRRIVEVSPVGKRQMLEINGAVTQQYIPI